MTMTLQEFTAEEEARLATFDRAPDAPESYAATVERMARAILDSWDQAPGEWDMTTDGITWTELARMSARAALAAMPPADEALRERVEGLRRGSETAMRCLDRALDAMNRAVGMTAEHGPAVAIEFIADYLNDSDGIDEDVADNAPDDWLTRWTVTRAALGGAS